ncbi:hypothetical protein WICMUC_004341 [Wickerhamomyces mucosus]|uniref:Uncharacterized protein n=1 Tax=Wickerhamomyces mucosus TaxID=1378264 RepID=A0A9P8TBJ8_9ASCO|nr:hypothetical protein WICMUC_004341 [Wickerhamomyces mucosus]
MNGVKFSVQTGSDGNAALIKYILFSGSKSGISSDELNDLTGYIVFDPSMKFIDAQNNPDKELVSEIQLAKASSLVLASMDAQISTPMPPEFIP